MKGYWISLYTKIENQENLKKYAEAATPIIKSYGGVPLVRGGRSQSFEGDNFLRTVVWEFPNYQKAIDSYIEVHKIHPNLKTPLMMIDKLQSQIKKESI